MSGNDRGQADYKMTFSRQELKFLLKALEYLSWEQEQYLEKITAVSPTSLRKMLEYYYDRI